MLLSLYQSPITRFLIAFLRVLPVGIMLELGRVSSTESALAALPIVTSFSIASQAITSFVISSTFMSAAFKVATLAKKAAATLPSKVVPYLLPPFLELTSQLPTLKNSLVMVNLLPSCSYRFDAPETEA